MTGSDRRIERFLAGLEALVSRGDRGALATLRRGLGKPPGTVIEVFPYVVPYLPDDADERQAWPFFTVAPLFAFYSVSWPAADGARWHNFGASVAELERLRGQQSPGIEARFRRLLVAEREELHLHLYRMLTLFRPYQVPVSWADLLRDLDGWDHPERIVQRRWARAYVAQRERREGSSEGEEDLAFVMSTEDR